MAIGDLLDFIAIVLAIIAFLSDKIRKFVFLKFDKYELISFGAIFIFIHFLIFYSFWRELLLFPKCFEIKWGPLPSTYAYVLTLATVIYVARKIFYGHFPKKNWKKVIAFYEQLIEKKEYVDLVQFVEEYHLDDLKKYLKLNAKRPSYAFDKIEKEVEEYEKAIDNRSYVYGSEVFNRVITNKNFIRQAVNYRPTLFVNLIKRLKNQRNSREEFVVFVIEQIFRAKNEMFFEELKNLYEEGGKCGYQINKRERPLLYSLTKNLNSIVVNRAWKGPFNVAFEELHKHENINGSDMLNPNYAEEIDEDHLLEFSTFAAVRFMDVIVQKSICTSFGDDMWMAYFRLTIRRICRLLEEDEIEKLEIGSVENTILYHIAGEIFHVIKRWKELCLSKKSTTLNRVYELYFECIYEMSISERVSIELIADLAKGMFNSYIEAYGYDNEIDEESIVKKHMSKPSTLFDSVEKYENADTRFKQVMSNLIESVDTFNMDDIKTSRYNGVISIKDGWN